MILSKPHNDMLTMLLATHVKSLLRFKHFYPENVPIRTHIIELFQLKNMFFPNILIIIRLHHHLLTMTWNYYRYSLILYIHQYFFRSKNLLLSLQVLSLKVLYQHPIKHKIKALQIDKTPQRKANVKTILFRLCA